MTSNLISEIHTDTKKWTAKIIVAEKCSTKISQNGVPYQAMLLMDIKGTTIRATIYERHIPPLSNTLKVGQTYLISNANVSEVPRPYRTYVGELQWSITGGCNVTEVQEDHHDLVFSRIKLSSFTELGPLKNRGIPTTTIGMVIAAYPMRPGPSKTGEEYMIRDIILMNKSFETVKMRLWPFYAENEGQEITDSVEKTPIIIAKNVLVKTFEGLGLSTTHNTCIYIDTPFKEVLAYREWINENEATITEIKALQKYLTLKKIEATENDIASPIKDVIEMPTKDHCWIKAIASVRQAEAPYWYMSCSICFTSSTETVAGKNFTCRYCKQTQATAIPRARIELELFDNTETISASAIGRPAEEFLQATASKLIGLTRADMNLEDHIRLNINDAHLFYIKVLPGRHLSPDAAKSVYSRPQKKFEVVALDEYNPQKHKNIPLNIIADQLDAPASASSEPLATTNIGTTSPLVKRALFQDPTPPTSKKKLISKMD